MANSNIKIVVCVAALLIALFAGVFINYSNKKDPTAIKRLSEKESSLGDARPSGGDTAKDNDDTSFHFDGSLLDIIDRDGYSSKSSSDSSKKDSSMAESSETDDPEDSEEFEEAARRYEEAAERLDEANAALDEAVDEMDRLRDELDDAEAELEEAKKRASDYDRGLYAFFESVGAYDALDLLNDSDFSYYIDMDDPDAPTSLKSVKRSIELLEKANELRIGEGRKELWVSYKMMALAALNNAASAAYNSPQNATDLDQNVAFRTDDPFGSWYYGEKHSEGGNYLSLISEDHIVAGYGFSSRSRNVHNLLFADADFDAGLVMSVSRLSDDFDEFYENAANNRDYSYYEDRYYELEEELEEAKERVSELEEEVDAAREEYESAKEKYEEMKESYETSSRSSDE